MKEKRKRKRKIIYTIATLALFFLITCGYLYYRICQVNISDIEQRIEERKQKSEVTKESTDIPGIFSGTLEKAESLSSKSIDPQDALDVAAILLKSGLSLKEMYYLTGKSTEQLSTEEKQKIRDLLLKKLTAEEISALRAITYDYGKGLNILDPNFPIELIGVYDREEYDRIKKELEDKRESKELTMSPLITSDPNVNQIPAAKKEIQSASPNSTPEYSSMTNDQMVIREKYQGNLDTLQSGCTNKVNALASEISTDIKASQDSKEGMSISTLQSKYLPKIEAAEKDCDSQFNELMGAATKAYQEKNLTLQDIENWKSQYETTKSNAQNQALSSLMSLLSK